MGGIVGSVLGASSQKKAAKKAADATLQAQQKNQAFATDTYNKNTAMFQPQTSYGDAADRMIAGLLGTGGDTAASANAYQTFRDSTGYQTNLTEGLNAVTANNAARGTFQSGATAKALQDRGTQLNNQYLQQFLGNLTNQSNTGTGAKGAIAGQGTNLTSNIIQANNTSAEAIGQKAISQANIFNNMLKNVGNSLTSSFTGGF
ncbi:hypothetical protein [Sphingomonas rubra]|uniref:DNA transfer protein n=1 Tax=Sphingomonas rubra TaxID=634430 RepID=A0A1I5UZ88_9SPHN|nr:hypothetical protein [Sphingomonas rubra]SFQ00551.1 hypothetical protein SAMN04488241_1215 [Sphingomonas rubra]